MLFIVAPGLVGVSAPPGRYSSLRRWWRCPVPKGTLPYRWACMKRQYAIMDLTDLYIAQFVTHFGIGMV
ncbi:MAG: hypothetical protein E6J91_20035 [Deltaproteobacteria bacterium]|nr:MAG: hypothetical protein E6J91_20035 [Deltaproteobacteria bacterium]